MGQKDLERLIGKLHSVHLAVPGEVACLFHIQRTLNQGGSELGVVISGITLQARELGGACPSGDVQADAPVRNCPLQTHLTGVSLRVWSRSGRCVAQPGRYGSQSSLEESLYSGCHLRVSLANQLTWHDRQLRPQARRPCSTEGHPPQGSS